MVYIKKYLTIFLIVIFINIYSTQIIKLFDAYHLYEIDVLKSNEVRFSFYFVLLKYLNNNILILKGNQL